MRACWMWHVPLEKGIGNQNTRVWILTLPRVKNKSTLPPWLWTGENNLAGRSRKLLGVKLSRKRCPELSLPSMLHSCGVLCTKVSTLAFPSLFIVAPILYMGKLRHVEVLVTSLRILHGGCYHGEHRLEVLILPTRPA